MNDDNNDIQELRANIVETRERLAAEVEEVGDRLTPGHAKEVAKEKILEAKDQAIETARDGAIRAGRTFADTVRDNPIPTAMVAVGAGWLLYETFGPKRKVERVARDAASSARGAVADTADVARAKLERAGSVAGDKAALVRDRASELVDEGRYQAQRGWVRTQDAYDAQPLAFGAAALVAGIGLGMLMPSTRREDELLGERRQQVIDRTKHLGEEAKQVALASAREGAQRAEQTAKREVRRSELPSNGRSYS